MIHLRHVALLAVAGVSLLLGCRASVSTAPPPPRTSPEPASAAPIRSQAESLEDLAHAVQTARDAPAEAAAIERLRRYERDHGLTYEIATTRLDSDAPVESGSVQSFPVRTTVAIYRGRVPVYSFTFIPKDNRNLALLGQ